MSTRENLQHQGKPAAPVSNLSNKSQKPITLSTSPLQGEDASTWEMEQPQVSEQQNSEVTSPGAAYEDTHVHAVYEAIAPHFSATRHKPWPRVAAFLNSQAPGSVGLDVGCGNGKYLPVNPHLHLLGSDRSAALVELARSQPIGSGAGVARKAEVLVADGLALPYRAGAVDFAICIAVIHHLSTPQRRRESITALLDRVRPGGTVLVYVWALEQASSRRGWDENSAQDTLVPWVMKGPKGDPNEGTTYQRYYHLYRKGELEDDVLAAGGTIVEAGYERDNWWVVCSKQKQPDDP